MKTITIVAIDAIPIIKKAKYITMFVNAFEDTIKVSKTETIRMLIQYKDSKITLYIHEDNTIQIESAN